MAGSARSAASGPGSRGGEGVDDLGAEVGPGLSAEFQVVTGEGDAQDRVAGPAALGGEQVQDHVPGEAVQRGVEQGGGVGVRGSRRPVRSRA
ncbi:hypothetical protein [Streptomyces virginiae]|uniref:hypothetical protein n=1 Tax=Streptomyces virginiae TaxID=1961 RepID=UPI0032501289